MEHSITHNLPLEQAQLAARNALQSYAERFAKYHPELAWSDERHASIAFTAKGIRFDGKLAIEADRFRLQLSVPMLFRPFSGRALKVLDAEARSWIDKAKSAT